MVFNATFNNISVTLIYSGDFSLLFLWPNIFLCIGLQNLTLSQNGIPLTGLTLPHFECRPLTI
jgi:hypothetical protein